MFFIHDNYNSEESNGLPFILFLFRTIIIMIIIIIIIRTNPNTKPNINPVLDFEGTDGANLGNIGVDGPDVGGIGTDGRHKHTFCTLGAGSPNIVFVQSTGPIIFA